MPMSLWKKKKKEKKTGANINLNLKTKSWITLGLQKSIAVKNLVAKTCYSLETTP